MQRMKVPGIRVTMDRTFRSSCAGISLLTMESGNLPSRSSNGPSGRSEVGEGVYSPVRFLPKRVSPMSTVI